MSEITAGERRELRTIVKGQYKVLRAEVKRREQELREEVEAELLNRYRDQNNAVQEANEELAKRYQDFLRDAQAIADRLHERRPELKTAFEMSYSGPHLRSHDPERQQLHRAAMARIPNIVGDALLNLDRGEVNLLRTLSEGALQTEEASAFLSNIPSVGELVPTVRLREIEATLARHDPLND